MDLEASLSSLLSFTHLFTIYDRTARQAIRYSNSREFESRYEWLYPCQITSYIDQFFGIAVCKVVLSSRVDDRRSGGPAKVQMLRSECEEWSKKVMSAILRKLEDSCPRASPTESNFENIDLL